MGGVLRLEPLRPSSPPRPFTSSCQFLWCAGERKLLAREQQLGKEVFEMEML